MRACIIFILYLSTYTYLYYINIIVYLYFNLHFNVIYQQTNIFFFCFFFYISKMRNIIFFSLNVSFIYSTKFIFKYLIIFIRALTKSFRLHIMQFPCCNIIIYNNYSFRTCWNIVFHEYMLLIDNNLSNNVYMKSRFVITMK